MSTMPPVQSITTQNHVYYSCKRLYNIRQFSIGLRHYERFDVGKTHINGKLY